MVYRVDAADRSDLQAQLALDQQAIHSGILTYSTGIGVGGELAQLAGDSTVVIAGSPDWPAAPQPLQAGSQTDDHTSREQLEAKREQTGGQSFNDGGKRDGPAKEPVTQHGFQVHETQSAASFNPVWEVDQLAWPESCDELFASEAEYFRHAGDKLREASGQGLRVLAVSSSRLGEGCTTLAMCLARAVAAGGGRVALMDCNLQHSALSSALGLEFSRGWQDAASGRMPLAEVAVTSISDGVTLFPLADIHEPIEPSHFSELLQQAAASVDLLILDTGPLATGRGCPIESGRSCPVNAAIVVRDLRTTSEQETLDTAACLRTLGIEAIGIAENYAADVVHAAA